MRFEIPAVMRQSVSIWFIDVLPSFIILFDSSPCVFELYDVYQVAEGVEKIDSCKDSGENRAAVDVSTRQNEDVVAKPSENIETTPAEGIEESKLAKDLPELNLTKDFQELKSKLTLMDAELLEVRLFRLKLDYYAFSVVYVSPSYID